MDRPQAPPDPTPRSEPIIKAYRSPAGQLDQFLETVSAICRNAPDAKVTAARDSNQVIVLAPRSYINRSLKAWPNQGCRWNRQPATGTAAGNLREPVAESGLPQPRPLAAPRIPAQGLPETAADPGGRQGGRRPRTALASHSGAATGTTLAGPVRTAVAIRAQRRQRSVDHAGRPAARDSVSAGSQAQPGSGARSGQGGRAVRPVDRCVGLGGSPRHHDTDAAGGTHFGRPATGSRGCLSWPTVRACRATWPIGDDQSAYGRDSGVRLVNYLFQQRADAGGAAGAAAGADDSLDSSVVPNVPGLNDLEVQTLPDLDVIILRGRDQDVEQLTKIIRELERISAETIPKIHIYPLQAHAR